jgi:hypothetical protein
MAFPLSCIPPDSGEIPQNFDARCMPAPILARGLRNPNRKYRALPSVNTSNKLALQGLGKLKEVIMSWEYALK